MQDDGTRQSQAKLGLKTPSAWAFRSIMLAPALKAGRGAIDRAFRPTDLSNPAELEKIVSLYSAMDTARSELHPDVPKVIWMLWQQGWDTAPDLAIACAESWKRHNPGWEVRQLDEQSLAEYIDGYSNKIRPNLTRQARSDMVRTLLIHQHGGLWVDASLYCARPLDEWLPQVSSPGFFVFTDPRPYREIESWFLLGAKNNYFIDAMVELFDAYWRRFTREHRYFWMVYLMEYLAKTDSGAQRIWNEMGKLSALGPSAIAPHAFSTSPPSAILQIIDEQKIPVHKLNHRWRADDLSGTVLERLTGLETLKGPLI